MGSRGRDEMRENIPMEEGVHLDTFHSVEDEANGRRRSTRIHLV